MKFETNGFSGMGSGIGRTSNLVTGLIGAVIGACLGVAVWVIIYRLGYLAAIGGFAIVAGAMKGYEILGGGLDLKGVLFSVLVSLIMVYVANYISWAVECYVAFNEYTEITMSEAFKVLPDLIEYLDLKADFIKDLVIGYLLSIVGAASLVVNKIRAVS